MENADYRIQHRETGLYLLLEWDHEHSFTSQSAWWVRKLEWSSRLTLSEARGTAKRLMLNQAQYKICVRSCST